MLNAPTILVGTAVIVILAVAAYFTSRSIKTGGCSECKRCEHCSNRSCSESPERKNK